MGTSLDTISLANDFSAGGTESSRSNISASDPYLGALRIQSSLLPGTYKRVRSGLAKSLTKLPHEAANQPCLTSLYNAIRLKFTKIGLIHSQKIPINIGILLAQ